MIGVMLYTLMEFLNFYVAYKVVFGITFTKRKNPYVFVILATWAVQIGVMYLVDDTWRDIVATIAGMFGATVLTQSKKWKVLCLYPLVFFLSSFINVLGSYGIAALLGITQQIVVDSIVLTLLAECTAIIIFTVIGIIMKKYCHREISLSAGQYLVFLVGAVCFFAIIGFAQGVFQEEMGTLIKMKNVIVLASVAVAFLFILLSVWQQITWREKLRYQMENEKYEMFLAGQEEHIRMLMIEDEKRRKLRHDMNAHMLAMRTMAEREEWDMLREYLGKMEESLADVAVNKYTMISAVDAIVDEWQRKALQHNAEWTWEGILGKIEGVTVFELCVLFSNLLSNAVEAIEKLEQNKRIEIKVSGFQGKNVISIGNTCGAVTMDGERLITSKSDKLFHGLGLKNVEEIVKKYNGHIDYEITEGWFQVNIVL